VKLPRLGHYNGGKQQAKSSMTRREFKKFGPGVGKKGGTIRGRSAKLGIGGIKTLAVTHKWWVFRGHQIWGHTLHKTIVKNSWEAKPSPNRSMGKQRHENTE